MACKSSDSSVNVEKILREERDIPGAELPRPAEQCTKAMLKRWLSCRGGESLFQMQNSHHKKGEFLFS